MCGFVVSFPMMIYDGETVSYLHKSATRNAAPDKTITLGAPGRLGGFASVDGKVGTAKFISGEHNIVKKPGAHVRFAYHLE